MFPLLAQEHMTFKGIEMNCSVESFASKLSAKGFTRLGRIEEDNAIAMSGSFATYNNCTLYLVGAPNGKLVKVVVAFPQADSWRTLYNNYYSTIKNLLDIKYGKPAFSEEKWQSRIEPEDDNSKFGEVMMDRCNFDAEYDTTKGNIEFMIVGGMNGKSVTLIYYDSIGQDSAIESALEDL